MHITGFALENWLTHRHLDVSLRPLSLICGPNESGKTAFAEAIAFGMMNIVPRGLPKGARADLISQGAKAGSVTLVCDGEGATGIRFTRDIATGKAKGKPVKLPVSQELVQAGIQPALDPGLFAALEPNERRQLLLDVCRVVMTPAHLKDLLARRGHYLAAELPDDMPPEAWVTYCTEQASQARGAWKAITGETYGDNKGATWMMDVPTVEGDQAQLEQDVAGLRSQLKALIEESGGARQQVAAKTVRDAKIAALKELAGSWDAAIAAQAEADQKMEAAETFRAKAAATVEEALSRKPAPLACTACGAKHRLERGVLVATDDTADDRPLPTESDILNLKYLLSRADEVVRGARTVTASAAERLVRIRAAEEQIIELEADAKEAGATVNLEKITDWIARIEKETLPATLDKLAAVQQAAASREKAEAKNAQAKECHKAVQDWVELKAQVSPDGLPAELLKGALQTFNQHLAALCVHFDWPTFAIGEDMEIMRGSIPYALLSESAQWRVDATLAMALSEVSEFRIVVLDRFDILTPKDRKPLLQSLYKLIKTDRLHTVLLMGTLASPPAVPSDVSVVWLGPDLKAAA